MALAQFTTIARAVYDLLRNDSRTKSLTWYYGRRTLQSTQILPAGGVSLGSVSDRAITMPKGREVIPQVLVSILFKNERGIEFAEEDMQRGLDYVLEVLSEQRNFGLSWVVNYTAEVDTDSDPEAVPPTATAAIRLNVQLRIGY